MNDDFLLIRHLSQRSGCASHPFVWAGILLVTDAGPVSG
jgi:hypothetical protein